MAKGLVLTLIAASVTLRAADELKSYESRVDISAQGICKCYQLTLSQRHGWLNPGDKRGLLVSGDEYEAGGWRKFKMYFQREGGIGNYRVSVGSEEDSPQRSVSLVAPARAWVPDTRMAFRRSALPNENAVNGVGSDDFYGPAIDPDYMVYPVRPPSLQRTTYDSDFPISPSNPGLPRKLFKAAQHDTRGRRYVISYGVKGHHQFMDLEGFWPLRHESAMVSIYDAKSKIRLVTLSMKPKGQYFRTEQAIRNSVLIENRFVVIPTTNGSEILYVCDLDSRDDGLAGK